ncbi:MAG: polyisoprenoid-binding protein [Burkholderiales bacterium]|nr:MAG: polyisoprenoid-binding protein [Burkholderiales bacterium]
MRKSLTLLAATATLAAAGLAQAAEYKIDPTHTNVIWEQLHFNTSTNRGRWAKKSGTVQFDRAARTGKVELTLDMTSVDTGVAPFDNHLKGNDFFAADQYPTATYVSDRFVFDGDKVTEVQGKLTLRGQTHPVTLKAVRFNCFDHPMLKREVCGGDFEATIKRSQWGVNWGLNMGVPDDTRIIIQVEAIRQ